MHNSPNNRECSTHVLMGGYQEGFSSVHVAIVLKIGEQEMFLKGLESARTFQLAMFLSGRV